MPVTYVDKIYYNNSQYSRGYKGSELLWDKKPDFFYIENLYNGLNTITLKKNGSPTTGTDIEWSGDLATWTPVTYNADNEFLIGLPNQNQKVWFRSTTGLSSSVDDFFSLSGSEVHKAGGDARTLLDYTAPTLSETEPNCFRKLFISDINLTDISSIDLSKLTVLNLSCYREMFRGTGITYIPSGFLPATNFNNWYCYNSMFRDCTSLTQAPALPATTLSDYCYSSMFFNCTSLTQAPALPATTLAEGCYYQMFYNCTSLVTAPTSLPATTLADYCYSNMFRDCTSLTQAPALPATTLAKSCYYQMFQGCTSLVNAPSLPATTLAKECYRFMFNGCTSLTQAPKELPATSSAESCYRAMFQNCSSLVIAPDIHCSPDSETAFSYMFSGCTSLNKIVVYSTTWDTNNTANFTTNVASSGLFINYNNISITTGSTRGIPTGWTSRQYDYFCVHIDKQVTLSFDKIGSPSGTVQYSFNGTSWSTITRWPFSSIVNPQTKLFIRVTGRTNTNSSNYFIYNFYTFKVSGDIRTLLDYTNTSLDTAGEYSFYKSIAYAGDASELVMHRIKNLNTGCFESMFEGNTILTKAPELPSTNLASDCYKNMFKGCTSLVQAPALPATTLAQSCYNSMFYGCTSLTQAPALPATTLAKSCYNSMFYGCTSLAQGPSILPATTLANYCYSYMFRNCSSLLQAPELPAATPVTGCYVQMFTGCSLINRIVVRATSWVESYADGWVYQTASTGDFYNLGGANIPTSDSYGIPSGWTEHTTL